MSFFVVILTSLFFITGCNKNDDEINSVKSNIEYPSLTDDNLKTDSSESQEEVISHNDDYNESTLGLEENNDEHEEINQAKQDVIDAQDDLNKSVRALSYGDWKDDLPTVKRKLLDLESANDDLNSLDDDAGSDLDWEISRMKRELNRLEEENWQDVVPDIESRNRSIESESDDIESSIEP
jgi:hypothetical protein